MFLWEPRGAKHPGAGRIHSTLKGAAVAAIGKLVALTDLEML